MTEELVVSMLDKAAELGITPDDPRFPVVQLERWVYPEFVHGIASGAPVPLKGAPDDGRDGSGPMQGWTGAVRPLQDSGKRVKRLAWPYPRRSGSRLRGSTRVGLPARASCPHP